MFTPEQRQIFGPYFNGVQPVYGDPLCLYRRLVHALDGEPGRYLRGLKDAVEDVRFEAAEKLIAAARSVFGLVPFQPDTGQGTLDREALTVLRQFILWRDEQKKNGPMKSTLPTPAPDAATCHGP